MDANTLTYKVTLDKIQPNTNNPRLIKDYKFNKLVKSLKDFPDMLKIRPIVVNKDFVILGGNMRYQAAIEANLKEVWITKVDLTEDQEREFIIKDNVGFGEWDWDLLANDWDNQKLNEWGLDVWMPTETEDLEDFFKDEDHSKEESTVKRIVLEYDEDKYNEIQKVLETAKMTPEEIFLEKIGFIVVVIVKFEYL